MKIRSLIAEKTLPLEAKCNCVLSKPSHSISLNGQSKIFFLFLAFMSVFVFCEDAQAVTYSCAPGTVTLSPHFSSNATNTQVGLGPTPLQAQSTPTPSTINLTGCAPNTIINARASGSSPVRAPNGLYYGYTGFLLSPPKGGTVYAFVMLSVNGFALADVQSSISNVGTTDANGNATIQLSNYVSSFYSPNGTNPDGSFSGTSNPDKIYISVGISSQPTISIFPYISANAITPDTSCTINNNNATNITFPDLQVRDFVSSGQPIIKAKKNVSLGVVCTGGSVTSLSAQFTGSEAIGNTGGVATSNTDVGIRIEDASGASVAINSGSEPIIMNSNSGTLTFSVTPYNSSGGTPGVGAYTSVATINVFIP